MEQIFDRVISAFSVEYMLSVIIASYFVIKFIDFANGGKAVSEIVKRLITFAVGAVSFGLFKYYTALSFETLVSSYFAAVFFYDAVIKYLIRKFDIDYKKRTDEDADNN